MVSRLLGLVAIALAVGACATSAPTYQAVPLGLPARPALPAIGGAELHCLSADTYVRLVERDRLRRDYVEQLEGGDDLAHFWVE